MEPRVATRWALNPISVFIGGFALGIFLSSFVTVSPLLSLLIWVVSFAILVVEKLERGEVGEEVLLVVLILSSFALGSFRYAIKDFHQIELPSSRGVVVDEPGETENGRRFTYQADNGEKVLVSVPLYTEVAYGDRVEVKGVPKRPGVIEEESGRPFDYGAYLSKDDIYWTVGFASVTVLAHNQGNPLKALLLKLKASFVTHAQAILPEPQASLLAGLIVSGKESLPAGIIEEFRRAGIVHIVVLSGFNITLIAEFLRKIFQRIFLLTAVSIAPLASTLASATGILFFVLMTGGSATVVRAAAMAFIALLAKLSGRSFSAPQALAVAAFLMLLENPKILVFDPSFQLSFLATIGLISIMPIVERGLEWVSERGQLKEIVAQTLATQLAVLPLLVYSTGNLSIVSLPANILILPIVPFTMLVGFGAVLTSYISPILAWPVSLVTHLLLSWILFVAHFFGTLSFATINIPTTWWVVALIYVLVSGGIILGWRGRNSLRSLTS